jgi:deoxyribonucleoside regulator
VLVQSGFVTLEDQQRLVALGAVGDILSRYITADGAIADPTIDDRTIGLRLEDCRNRDYAIGVAAGRGKEAIALACLRAGYVNALVTDEQTALHLLDETRS